MSKINEKNESAAVELHKTFSLGCIIVMIINKNRDVRRKENLERFDGHWNFQFLLELSY